MKKLTLLLTIFPLTLLALVDYSDPVTSKGTRTSQPVLGKQTSSVSSSDSSSLKFFDEFSLGMGMESLAVNRGDDKVNFYRMDTHIQFPFSVFLEGDYWWASADEPSIAPVGDRMQNGNGTVKLGFNWIRFGTAENLAGIDMYAGVRVPEKNSDFATSRLDKILGVDLIKRFYTFALGISYEMNLTGTPKKSHEEDIGNIQKLSATLAWAATDDIAFEFEAKQYMVASSDVSSEVKWSQFTPQLNLSIASFVDLQLGARFLSGALKNEQLNFDKRLWTLDGAYGNSIFAALKLGF